MQAILTSFARTSLRILLGIVLLPVAVAYGYVCCVILAMPLLFVLTAAFFIACKNFIVRGRFTTSVYDREPRVEIKI
jgi:hypothetical protein